MAKQPARPRTTRPRNPKATAADAAVAGSNGAEAPNTTTITASRRTEPQVSLTDQTSALRSESMSSEPSEEDIRVRAYHRFLARGGQPGNDFEDWLDAERELKNQR